MTTQHQPRESRFFLLALALILALVAAPPVLADDDDDDGGGTTSVNRCAIKFVCGDATESLRAVDGTYRTAINVLNAGSTSVGYRKKVALTTPCLDPETGEEEGFEQPGPVSGPLPGNGTPFMLASMHAFDVDCNEIFNEFDADSACAGELDFMEGFLIIESNGPLDVTAVYTGGAGSIDVEAVSCKGGGGGDDDDDD